MVGLALGLPYNLTIRPHHRMTPSPLVSLFQTHSRSFEDNRFVYAVVSRRSGGVSIGVNLNPEKYCNFDCVYCQVDRTVRGGPVLRKIDLPQLAGELDEMVELAVTGRLFEGTRFSTTPAEYRRLNDIAMSGDGEPTASPIFDEVVQLCADIRRRRGLDQVKLVLITNATLLQRERVRKALEVLDANNGEIWGKLDAGTEDVLPGGRPLESQTGRGAGEPRWSRPASGPS